MNGLLLNLACLFRCSPFEVESALIEHPAVAESAVIGEADATRGQLVVAYIILAAGDHRHSAKCGMATALL